MLCWAVHTLQSVCTSSRAISTTRGNARQEQLQVISPGILLPVLLLCFPETASLAVDSLNSRSSCLPHVEIEVLCHFISVSAVFHGKALWSGPKHGASKKFEN